MRNIGKMRAKWLAGAGLACVAVLAGFAASSAQNQSAASLRKSRPIGSEASISLSTADRVQDEAWWPTKGKAPRSAYAGNEECDQCHHDKVTSQRQTEMAKASTRSLDPADLDGQQRVHFQQGAYDYSIARSGNIVAESVTDGRTSLSRPVLFSFGEGVVGHTYIYEDAGNLYESHVSYYSSIKGLDLTTGHPQAQFGDLSQALGRPLELQEAQRCFGCHTTASTTSGRFDPSQAIAGVTCEACHGPGARHAQAMMAGQLEQGRKLIVSPGHFDTARAIDFCGACHRTPGDVIEMNVSGAVTVRFQPFRLEQSRCWKNAGERLTCVTCHNPHEPLVQDSAAYDAICMRCHAAKPGGERQTGELGVACRVSKVNCVGCHMPKVEIPGMHHAFADHWIRVARDSDTYLN